MTFLTRLLIYSGWVLWGLIIVAAVFVVMEIYDRRKEKDEDED